MKASKQFKEVIKVYLDKMAQEDELYAKVYAKPNKTLDECINFILQEVHKSGCNGFADEEIYGMAVHYYQEDDIKDIKAVKAQVVVNHHVELTKEEKDSIRRKAVEDFRKECLAEMRNRNKKVAEASKKAAEASKKPVAEQPKQKTLFDL